MADEIVTEEKVKDKNVLVRMAGAFGAAAGGTVGVILIAAGVMTSDPEPIDGVPISKDVAAIAVCKDRVRPASQVIKMVPDYAKDTTGKTQKPDTLFTPEAKVIDVNASIVTHAVAGDSVMLCYIKRAVGDTVWIMGDKALVTPGLKLGEDEQWLLSARIKSPVIVRK